MQHVYAYNIIYYYTHLHHEHAHCAHIAREQLLSQVWIGAGDLRQQVIVLGTQSEQLRVRGGGQVWWWWWWWWRVLV
jgi:hypothetical protein